MPSGLEYSQYKVTTIFGSFYLAAHDRGLCWLKNQRWNEINLKNKLDDQLRRDVILAKGAQQLKEYFDGQRKVFTLPISFSGTEFQEKVWMELLEIPYGAKESYGELANRIGRMSASRAVGFACASNPLWIVIPCHRILKKSGEIGGYAGGSELKKYLIRLEQSAKKA